MSAPSIESFLARLYTDAEMRARFLADPADAAKRAGLSPQDCAAVFEIDPIGLRLAARSFAHKRRKHAIRPSKTKVIVQRWFRKVRKLAALLLTA